MKCGHPLNTRATIQNRASLPFRCCAGFGTQLHSEVSEAKLILKRKYWYRRLRGLIPVPIAANQRQSQLPS